jgi:methyl-accepting chemotaxis protein
VVISFIVSHKFAGPIFKLEKSMDKVKKGDLTHKMYLREGDEFTQLAEIFNELVSEFRESVVLDRKLAKEIKSELEEIEPSLDAETKGKVEAIKEKADKLTGDWKIKEENR